MFDPFWYEMFGALILAVMAFVGLVWSLEGLVAVPENERLVERRKAVQYPIGE